MPENRKPDPFKPQQPVIPGVPQQKFSDPSGAPASDEQATTRSARGPSTWIAVAALGALFLGTGIYWWNRGAEAKPPAPAAATPAVQPAAAPARAAVEVLPVGPGKIASAAELAKTWSSKRFLFRNPSTDEEVQAIVVHLPNGQYWGFSTREPYGTCTLDYIPDTAQIAREFNYRTDHPLVADPCNYSLFDLLNYAQVPSGLVRGQIVMGDAVRPPVAIEIEKKGNDIFAIRSE